MADGQKRFSPVQWTPAFDAIVTAMIGGKRVASTAQITAKLNAAGCACAVWTVEKRLRFLREDAVKKAGLREPPAVNPLRVLRPMDKKLARRPVEDVSLEASKLAAGDQVFQRVIDAVFPTRRKPSAIHDGYL